MISGVTPEKFVHSCESRPLKAAFSQDPILSELQNRQGRLSAAASSVDRPKALQRHLCNTRD